MVEVIFFLLLLLQLHVFLILFIIIFLLVWPFKHILIHRAYFISQFLRFLHVLNKINSKLQIQHGVVPVRFLIIKKSHHGVTAIVKDYHCVSQLHDLFRHFAISAFLSLWLLLGKIWKDKMWVLLITYKCHVISTSNYVSYPYVENDEYIYLLGIILVDLP